MRLLLATCTRSHVAIADQVCAAPNQRHWHTKRTAKYPQVEKKLNVLFVHNPISFRSTGRARDLDTCQSRLRAQCHVELVVVAHIGNGFPTLDDADVPYRIPRRAQRHQLDLFGTSPILRHRHAHWWRLRQQRSHNIIHLITCDALFSAMLQHTWNYLVANRHRKARCASIKLGS